MNHHSHYARTERPVETCVVGSGGFGRSFLAQALRIPLINARVAVDRTSAIAADALRSIGLAERDFAECNAIALARDAWDRGLHV
ncbi:MAG: hypothetical protein ABI564_17985, partial [Ideonella sp.]